jgi:hypothetical protein
MATAKKKTAKKAKTAKGAVKHQTFKLSREKTPFLTFRVTEQTVYWAILLVLIFILALWVLNIQLYVADILSGVSAV